MSETKTVRQLVISMQEKVQYLLIEESVNGSSRYGIDVRSELFGYVEETSVMDITSDFEFGKKLLLALADNSVLPSTAKEVIADYVSAAFLV